MNLGDEGCFNVRACKLQSNILINRKNNLSLLCLNINSLRGKISALRAFISLSKINFTFVVLGEIKLTPVLDTDFELEGYKSTSLYRTEFGGGIKIYYLDSLNVVRNDDQNLTGIFDSHESLFISCLIPNYKKITLGAFYRPPSASKMLFIHNVEQMLSGIHRLDNVVLCGDFNLNMVEMGTPGPVSDFTSLMASFSLQNCITLPTHIVSGSSIPTSIIDHVWCNVAVPVSSFVVSPPLSDHLSCIAIFDVKVPITLNKIVFKDKSINRQQHFLNMIEDEYINYNFSSEDINRCVEHFDSWFRDLTEKYFPQKTKFISPKRLNSPWLTTRLIKCIRNKHWLYRKFKQNVITYEMYQTYCKLLNLTLKMAEQDCYLSRFTEVKGNTSKSWKILNKMLGKHVNNHTQEFLINNTMTNDNKVISDNFGAFFDTVPKTLKDNIVRPNDDLLGYIPFNTRSMYLFYATEDEVESVVKGLKTSNDKYEWSTFMLKLGTVYFSRIITTLFNQCLCQGVYPSLLKVARITPIFKRGKRSLIENYRPVSVLPVLNKIFEKLIFKRLDSFVESSDVLSES